MNLHQEFKKLAFDISEMKKKLIFLLLEIYEKEIYKEHGCATIYEYAFKYARLSKERVQKALRTLKNTENFPELRKEIATAGLDKVALVVKLATPENEKMLVQHVNTMPTPVLQQYAKEIRHGKCITPKMTIELDEEMQIIFNQLKKKYNTSNQETLRIILKNVSEDVSPKKIKARKTSDAHLPSRPPSIQKKREVDERSNGKCEYPNCTKPIENYHHTVPFAFSHSHDSLVGLCKIHHEFCHQGVVLNELQQPENWELSTKPNRSLFDNLYLGYKARPA